jgi:integrase
MSPAWVQAVKAEARPVEYRDTRQRQLVLRVEITGRKTWVCRYAFEGRPERATLGTFPEVSLAKARRAAEKTLGKAQDGVNLAGTRRAVRLGETVAEVAEAWLKSEDTRHWRPRSRKGFEALLENHILPRIGSVKLLKLTRAQVQAVLDGIERLHARNRTLEVVRMLCNWSVARGLIPMSPVAGIKKLREPKRTRTLTDDEIRAVVQAFDTTPFAEYVRLLFLTAARREELLSARWGDVYGDLWTIPAEAEKTGATRGEPRRLPLSKPALAALARQRERNMAAGRAGSPYIFPGPSGDRLHRDAPKAFVYRLKGLRDNGTKPRPHKLAKPRPRLIPEDLRLHDIRRSAADRMLNALGLDAYTVDVGVLGHAKPPMLAVYAPALPAKTKAAMAEWASELERILGERRRKGRRRAKA